MNMENIIEKYNQLKQKLFVNKPLEYFSLFQDRTDYNLVIGDMLLNHMEIGNSPERIGDLIGKKRSKGAFTQPVKDQINKVLMLGYDILESEEGGGEKVIQTYYNDLGLNIHAKILDEFTLADAFDPVGARCLEKKSLAMDEILKEFDKEYVKFVSFSDYSSGELNYASHIANMLSQHGKVAEVNTATKKIIYTPVGNTTIDVEYK